MSICARVRRERDINASQNILIGAVIALLTATTVIPTVVAVHLNNKLETLEKSEIESEKAGSVPMQNKGSRPRNDGVCPQDRGA